MPKKRVRRPADQMSFAPCLAIDVEVDEPQEGEAGPKDLWATRPIPPGLNISKLRKAEWIIIGNDIFQMQRQEPMPLVAVSPEAGDLSANQVN